MINQTSWWFIIVTVRIFQMGKDPDVRLDKFLVVGQVMPVEVSLYSRFSNTLLSVLVLNKITYLSHAPNKCSHVVWMNSVRFANLTVTHYQIVREVNILSLTSCHAKSSLNRTESFNVVNQKVADIWAPHFQDNKKI